MGIQPKRVHDPVAPGQGHRALADGVWPGGISRERARLDEWCRGWRRRRGRGAGSRIGASAGRRCGDRLARQPPVLDEPPRRAEGETVTLFSCLARLRAR